jgi:hypothetical protein
MSEDYQRGPGPGRGDWHMPKPGSYRTSPPTAAPCQWIDCTCSHRPPCVAGWIDEEVPMTDRAGRPLTKPDGTPIMRQQTKPGPTCRPEHRKILDNPMLTRGQQLARIRGLKER